MKEKIANFLELLCGLVGADFPMCLGTVAVEAEQLKSIFWITIFSQPRNQKTRLISSTIAEQLLSVCSPIVIFMVKAKELRLGFTAADTFTTVGHYCLKTLAALSLLRSLSFKGSARVATIPLRACRVDATLRTQAFSAAAMIFATFVASRSATEFSLRVVDFPALGARFHTV